MTPSSATRNAPGSARRVSTSAALDRVGVGDDALMHLGRGEVVELLAGDVLNGDAPACRARRAPTRSARPPRRDPHRAHTAPPRREQLGHGPPSLDLFPADAGGAHAALRRGVTDARWCRSVCPRRDARGRRARRGCGRPRRSPRSERAALRRCTSASISASSAPPPSSRSSPEHSGSSRTVDQAGRRSFDVALVERAVACHGRGRNTTAIASGVSKSSSIAALNRPWRPRRAAPRRGSLRLAPGGRARRAGRPLRCLLELARRRSRSGCGSGSAARACGTRAGRARRGRPSAS